MNRLFITGCFLLGMLLIGGGCETRTPDGDRQRNASDTIHPKAITGTVELIDESGLQQLVQERNGKLLVLNIWATWCLPCVEEFPDLIKLSKVQSEIEVIGISVDFPDEAASKVAPFLKKRDVPFKVYIANFRKQEDFINAINVSWQGALPATFIYDRLGKQRASIIGQTTYGQLQKKIDQVHAE